MAIRIRNIDGFVVALCAARTLAEPDDLYLDDNVHHALTTKFSLDFLKEGFLSVDLADERLKERTENTEVSDA